MATTIGSSSYFATGLASPAERRGRPRRAVERPVATRDARHRPRAGAARAESIIVPFEDWTALTGRVSRLVVLAAAILAGALMLAFIVAVLVQPVAPATT